MKPGKRTEAAASGTLIQRWSTAGTASWDDEILTLTPDVTSSVGGALGLDAELPRGDWEVAFDVRVTGRPDGVALLFVDRDRVDLDDWLRGPGGYMGLRNDESQGVPGWAVELDLHPNPSADDLGDPAGPHAALVEDGQQQVPIAVAQMPSLPLDTWTPVRVRCLPVGLTVDVAGERVLTVTDWISRGERGLIGLTGATGSVAGRQQVRAVEVYGDDLQPIGSDSGEHP